MTLLLQELYREFGLKSRLTAAIAGPIVLWKIRREEQRLAAGWTYEPPTFYESNYDSAGPGSDKPRTARCQFVEPRIGTPQTAAASDESVSLPG